MMPMPPAAETAAMSSTSEQGYMAPQMSGISMPAWAQSVVWVMGPGGMAMGGMGCWCGSGG